MRKKVNASYDASNVDDIPIGLLQRHGTFRRTTIAPIERPSEYTQKKDKLLHVTHRTQHERANKGGGREGRKGEREEKQNGFSSQPNQDRYRGNGSYCVNMWRRLIQTYVLLDHVVYEMGRGAVLACAVCEIVVVVLKDMSLQVPSCIICNV